MLEMRTGMMVTLSLCATLALAGCGEKTEGDKAAPSAKPTGAATAAATPLRNAAGKLTKAGFDAAWKEVYRSNTAMNEPAEKKLAAFEAKVGKAAKMEGDKRVYWVFEGADCHKMEIGVDGTKGAEKVAADKCEK